MATTIQVILQSDVTNVGTLGELVKVRPGFARNFLIPRSLAVPATASAINRISHEKAVAVAKSDKTKKEAKELADKIGKLSLKVSQRVGEDNRLFGSVTSKDVEAAAKAAGIEIDRKKIHLPEIKSLGNYEASVRLMPDVTATLKFEVIAK